MKSTTFAVLTLTVSAPLALGQSAGFGGQQVISATADGAWNVVPADLDGDGDVDVLSASRLDDKVAWYENLGGGVFGPEQVLTTAADDVEGIHAADLDGDGDLDVLSASQLDNKVAWYENLGGGPFGPQQVLQGPTMRPRDVFATDLDGDGDPDVLASLWGGATQVVWFENLGAGAFGPPQAIETTAFEAYDILAADLDGDGDEDVLTTRPEYGEVLWYENLGAGTFGAREVIASGLSYAANASVSDIDGDGDLDVVAAVNGSTIAWYKNYFGTGSTWFKVVITEAAAGVLGVHAADIDGDGDDDVLSASFAPNGTISWYENFGGGTFGPLQALTTSMGGAFHVQAADLDGDGDLDVLSPSYPQDSVAWNENLGDFVITYCMQGKTTSVLGCQAQLEVPDRTLATGAWSATDIPRSWTLPAGTSLGIYIYTHGVGLGQSNVSASLPFGTLCLSGFKRSAPACAPALLPDAQPNVCNVGPMTTELACNGGALGIAVGEDVNVQLWYRDPTTAAPGNANLSNAVFYTVQ